MTGYGKAMMAACVALAAVLFLNNCGDDNGASNPSYPSNQQPADKFEPNDSMSAASTGLVPGAAVNGLINCSTDVDYFIIDLAVDGAIAITLVPPASQDYILELYDAGGILVDAANSGGAGQAETLSYDGTAGMYYVKIAGAAGAFDAAAVYSLSGTWADTTVAGLPLTVDVTTTGAGSGRVVSLPSRIDCPSICSATFPDGSVMLTAIPASNGATFEGWSGACSGTANPCILTRQDTMSVNQAVTATFGQVYSGSSLTGSGSITRPMTYGTCTWTSTFVCSVSLRIVGWRNGSLAGTMTVICDRSEPAGTASNPAQQTCLAGGAHYEDSGPISGTPSNITWNAAPLGTSSFLNASFTGAVSGNTGQLGGDSVTGTLSISTFGDATGSATIPVSLTR